MTNYRGHSFNHRGQHQDLGEYILDTPPAEYFRHDRFYGVMLSSWRVFSLDDERGFVQVRTYYRPLER